MWIWLPIPLLYVTLGLLLRAEAQHPRDDRQVKIWKPITTALVMLVCVLSLTRPAGERDAAYTSLILMGLLFSLIGDVLLIPQDNPRAFLFGLVAFLLAHVTYIAGFLYAQSSLALERNTTAEVITAAALLFVAAATYAYLHPALGKMRLPVIAYSIVISLMVHRAFAIAWVHPGPGPLPVLLAVGALLFFVSDVILAINKFRLAGRMPRYRPMNLSTYYTGQLLIALSAAFMV